MRLLIAAMLSFLLIPSALACACEPSTPQARFDGTSVIFEGTVISVGSSLLGDGQTTLRVERIYKGIDTSYVTVKTNLRSSCAYEFKRGETYVVYASESLSVNLCSGTTRTEEADRTFLGDGRAPPEESFFGMMSLRQNLAWVVIFIVLVIIGTAWHLRQKKRLGAT